MSTATDDDESDGYCAACAGTGIGRGDPDTSKCGRCGGKGYVRPADDSDRGDYERDRAIDDALTGDCPENYEGP